MVKTIKIELYIRIIDDKNVLQYNSISLDKLEIISPLRDFLAGKFQKEY